jgi:hypothetical protein
MAKMIVEWRNEKYVYTCSSTLARACRVVVSIFIRERLARAYGLAQRAVVWIALAEQSDVKPIVR